MSKFGNLPVSGKFCAIEVACNFENLPIFCLNPPYFLDVDVGISARSHVWMHFKGVSILTKGTFTHDSHD